MTVLISFIGLSLLVFLHEFGHFLAAKISKIHVEEFGLGLPPRILAIKIKETFYSLNLLPFGGFVKVFAEEREDSLKNIPSRLKKKAFIFQPLKKRIFIVTAGVIANFLFGWLIISYLFSSGTMVPTSKIIISQVLKNTPAEKAGLKPNDVISKFLPPDRLTPIKLKNSEEFIQLTKKYAGQPVIIFVKREKKEISLKIVPRVNPPKGQGPLGVVISSFVFKKYPWYQAPVFGLLEAFNITKLTIKEIVRSLVSLLSFKKPEVQVTGPVGIFKITNQAAQSGINTFLYILSLLSLNLAVINILPFPALDGGRLAFLFYEGIFKKRPPASFEKTLNMIGFIILLSLIMVITISDINKLVR